MLVLLYGCEVWGFENIEIIECIYLKFLKYILNLKSCILLYMVYGEIGRFLLFVNIYIRMVLYWVKLFIGLENKIVYIFYKYLLN